MTDQSNDIVDPAATENTGAESQEIKEWGQEETQEPKQTQEGGEGKEEGQEPEKTEPEKPKKSRAQERIEQLARENAELKRKQAEFESKKDTQEIKRPKIEEFEDYSQYEDAMEEYHVAKAEQRVLEKLNQKEPKTKFTKLFSVGVGMLAELKQEGKINYGDIGKLLLLMPRIEQDTGYLVDGSGKYMNKAQLAEMVKDSRSNFNKTFKRLQGGGAMSEDKLDGEMVISCSNLIAYNGINRVNQH